MRTSVRQSLTDAREERASLREDLQALIESAEAEQRDLTALEAEQFDAAERAHDVVDARIKRLEATLDGGGRRLTIGPGNVGELYRANGRRDGDDPRTPLLGREARMADWAAKRPDRSGFTVDDAGEFCLGNIMRAMVDPAFRSELSDVERRALAEGVDATGGFITPEPLSVNLIDRVRNQARVFEAGATTVPLDSDKQSIPRLSGDPVGGWRNENAAFAESQHAFERVTFTPQSYGFIVRSSEELYQDMVPGAGLIIENSITQTAAIELDRVALRGSGTAPEPRGVRNQAGVTIQSLGVNGGALSNYTDLMTAITTLLTANRQPTGVVLSPRTSQKYAGLTDTTNQPLTQPRPVAELPFYPTGQIPNNLTQGTGTNTSEAYVGRWSDLMVGIRLGIQLRLLQERYADTGQYAWRVFLRADVQLAHPESFVVVTGILP